MDSVSSSASLHCRSLAVYPDYRFGIRLTQVDPTRREIYFNSVYIGYLLAGIFLLDSLENRIDVDVGSELYLCSWL